MRKFSDDIEEHELRGQFLLLDSVPIPARLVKWYIRDLQHKQAGTERPRFPYFDDLEKMVDLFQKSGIVSEGGPLTEKGELLKDFLHI